MLYLHTQLFLFPVSLPWCHSTSLLAFLLFPPYPTKEWGEQEAGWVFGCWSGSYTNGGGERNDWLKGSTHMPQVEILRYSGSFPESPAFLILACYQYVLHNTNLSENQPQSAPAVAAAMKSYLQKRSDLLLLAHRQPLLQQCSGNSLLSFPWLLYGFSGNSL